MLNKNADIDILVEGHTDNIPIKTALYRDNWDLSVARSISIVRILTDDYKIAPLRLTASRKGEFTPAPRILLLKEEHWTVGRNNFIAETGWNYAIA